MAEICPATLVHLIERRFCASGPEVALHNPSPHGFQRLTWHDLRLEITQMANFLLSLGVQPGDRVAQVSANRREWIILDLAIHLVQAVHVAIHAPLSGSQIAVQITDSGAKIAFLSGPEQATKLNDPDIELSPDILFFSYEPCSANLSASQEAGSKPRLAVECIRRESPGCRTAQWSDFRNWTELLEEALLKAQPEDLATILYSSGTTGEPKGVLLTHANLVSNAWSMSETFDYTPDDLRLCFLPLSHIFARTCDLYTWLCRGSQLALAESRDRILANCQELRPTLLNGVPYFYEKVMRTICEAGSVTEPQQLINTFGGRIRACCSGGAALPVQVSQWYEQQGLPLLQGYGLTETSPVISMSTRAAYRHGTVGRALRNVEIQIAADGEILTRGPHLMAGYWNRPAETDAVIREGWLHTGDVGEIDAEGYLTITGRKKELIVLASGKNVAPVALEALLCQDSLIEQAVVFGEGRNFLVALLVPNPHRLREEIFKRQIPVTSREQALQHPEVWAMYRQALDQRTQGVSRQEQIARFALLDRAFSIESGELTPTLKMRRSIIQTNFSSLIESLYAG